MSDHEQGAIAAQQDPPPRDRRGSDEAFAEIVFGEDFGRAASAKYKGLPVSLTRSTLPSPDTVFGMRAVFAGVAGPHAPENVWAVALGARTGDESTIWQARRVRRRRFGYVPTAHG